MILDKIKQLKEDLNKELEKAVSLEQTKNIWQKYLGSKGLIKKLLSKIGCFTMEEKKEKAPLLQKIYKDSIELFKKREQNLKNKKDKANLFLKAEKINLKSFKIGHLHPITLTIRKMNKAFTDMGYSIIDGPEMEEDEYCFQRLNVPIDHPARDMQDTIYIESPNILLRTQTSSIEARLLATQKPPFKVVSPGRVYRNETVSKSNHFVFHQWQGVVVLEKVNLKDLFGTFSYLFKKMYGPEVVVRYRSKYYPEVEPGVGPDMQCFNCHGKGCSLCKGVGWIEMGGAGIIHPKVMKMAGIDTKKWMGFAFGMGLDRWVMAKYNITDIRTLLGGNLGYKYYENENTL